MGFDLDKKSKGFADFKHHSNPNRPDGVILFDKLVMRPERNRAWELIKAGDSERGFDILRDHGYYKDHLGNIIYNDAPVMLFGRAVQYYCDLVLLEDQNPNEAYREAINMIQGYQSPHWRNAADEKDRIDDVVNGVYYDDKGRKPTKKDEKANVTKTLFQLVADNALAGMQEAMTGANQITGEEKLEGKLEGCRLPYIGFGDYNAGTVELKTKWSENIFDTEGNPKRLQKNYRKQIAGYWHLTGNMPKLVMSGRNGYHIYRPTAEELENALRLVKTDCQRLEENLYSRTTKEAVLRSCEVDFEVKFYWGDIHPRHKALAEKMWGVADGF